jgi:uncharacterized protein (DUF1778 family)
LTRTEIYRTLYIEAKEMSNGEARTKARKASGSKVFRFDARLNRDQRVLIQRAAELEGRTMTDFVLHSAQLAAERTIQERGVLILSARETKAFVDAILRPAEPGRVLRSAAKAYKRRMSLQ